jgi:DeoR/GlpR family transcriptional regulator of sugar metabolism
VRRAFLSGNGLTAVHGMSTPNAGVAGIDRAMANTANEVVVLADSTKIGVDTMVRTVPTSGITHVVTDAAASAAEVAALQAAGVQVHIAKQTV